MIQTEARPESEKLQNAVDTIISEQSNGLNGVQTIPVFALDIGNRENKLGFGDEILKYPSYQAVRPSRQDFDFLPEDSWLIHQGAIEWVVGRVAENLAIPTYLGNKWDHSKVFLYGAIAKAGMTGEVHIEKLRLSTPDKQSVEQVDRLTGLKGPHSFSWNGKDVSLVVSSVQIVDEGVSSWLNANRLKLWQYPHYLNAVLDAGGGTLIGRVICPNTGVIREAEFVIDGGTSRLASQIESELGLSNVTALIMDCIEREDLILPSGLAFSNTFGRCKTRWHSELKAQIKNRWLPYQDRMAQVLIVGGSAPLFKDWVEDGGRYVIPPDPQTFGVEGLLHG